MNLMKIKIVQRWTPKAYQIHRKSFKKSVLSSKIAQDLIFDRFSMDLGPCLDTILDQFGSQDMIWEPFWINFGSRI